MSGPNGIVHLKTSVVRLATQDFDLVLVIVALKPNLVVHLVLRETAKEEKILSLTNVTLNHALNANPGKNGAIVHNPAKAEGRVEKINYFIDTGSVHLNTLVLF